MCETARNGYCWLACEIENAAVFPPLPRMICGLFGYWRRSHRRGRHQQSIKTRHEIIDVAAEPLPHMLCRHIVGDEPFGIALDHAPQALAKTLRPIADGLTMGGGGLGKCCFYCAIGRLSIRHLCFNNFCPEVAKNLHGTVNKLANFGVPAFEEIFARHA